MTANCGGQSLLKLQAGGGDPAGGAVWSRDLDPRADGDDRVDFFCGGNFELGGVVITLGGGEVGESAEGEPSLGEVAFDVARVDAAKPAGVVDVVIEELDGFLGRDGREYNEVGGVTTGEGNGGLGRRRTDGETLAQVEARERFAGALNAFDRFDVIAEFGECGATEVAGFGAEFRGARFDRDFF